MWKVQEKYRGFSLVKEFYFDSRFNEYVVAGVVGQTDKQKETDEEINVIEV